MGSGAGVEAGGGVRKAGRRRAESSEEMRLAIEACLAETWRKWDEILRANPWRYYQGLPNDPQSRTPWGGGGVNRHPYG